MYVLKATSTDILRDSVVKFLQFESERYRESALREKRITYKKRDETAANVLTLIATEIAYARLEP